MGWAEIGGEDGLLNGVAIDDGADAQACASNRSTGVAEWWAAVQQRVISIGGVRVDEGGLMYSIPNFLTSEEVEQVIELGKTREQV